MKRIFLFFIVGFSIFQAKGQNIKEITIIELDSLISKSSQPILVNFWATWCAPCLEELPYMQKLAKEEGVKLMLINMDNRRSYEDKLKDFVKSRNIRATHYWLNETNADYFCPFVDEKWSGSIPASLFINNKKKIRIFKEEKIEEEDLRKILKEIQ